MTDNIQSPNRRIANNFDTTDVILYIIAFVFPPFPVLIRSGFCSADFLLNLLLTAMFGLPGTIHALYIVYITSPVTGNPERRISLRYNNNGDYERIVENDEPNNDYQNQNQNKFNQSSNSQGIENFGSTSSNINNQPPAYNDIYSNVTDNKQTSTDNKVQLP
ncbi:hypothetical protein WICMUC_005477 [Wickerhamomyces mucosus]|uniref:Stress response RCI peptide n=1 Tax=Wickerhamomyces mucosus TaxID=1378264 RepID=A0A9P8P7I7_9ASCO|nr:hypothetical protein WICMUC_005477 [Wickerhamomyces mucosus]